MGSAVATEKHLEIEVYVFVKSLRTDYDQSSVRRASSGSQRDEMKNYSRTVAACLSGV
jgi:hypothetical protein